MRTANVWLMALVAMGLLAGTVQAGYVQGFESGEFVATESGTPGIYLGGDMSGWGVSRGAIYIVDALQASGVPQAAKGSRYASLDGFSDWAAQDNWYYFIFNLWQTDPRIETTAKQMVSFDFYVDPTSDTTKRPLWYAVYGNEVDTPYYGTNHWGYMSVGQVTRSGNAWYFGYGNGSGSYATGPAIAAGMWHHVDIHFDFSVQDPINKNGARQSIVLDGNTLVSNWNVDWWGANVDPAQLASVSSGNPFRCYWTSDNQTRTYIDSFSYAAEPSTLTGTVVPGNYTGDLGTVGIKVQLIQFGNVIKAYKTVLSDTGTFSIPQVPQGFYDIAIQGSNWLRKILPSRNVTGDTYDLGTIDLIGGDCDGSNGVDSTDLAIVLANMDQSGN